MLQVQEGLLVVQTHVVGCAGLPPQVQPQRSADLLFDTRVQYVSHQEVKTLILTAPYIFIEMVGLAAGALVKSHLPLLPAAHRVVATTVLHLPEHPVQVQLQPRKYDGLEFACAGTVRRLSQLLLQLSSLYSTEQINAWSYKQQISQIQGFMIPDTLEILAKGGRTTDAEQVVGE